MKTVVLNVKQLSLAEKKDLLGKSGRVEHMKDYIDLEKEDTAAGILFLDQNGRKIAYVGDMEHYDCDAVFNYLGGLQIKEQSRMSKGVTSKHIQIGFQPGNGLRGNFCSPTVSMHANKDLQVFGYYMALFGEEEYKRVMPEMYALHVEEMKRLKDKKMLISPRSLFTSAVINRSNQIQYHYDRGNTKEGATMMCYILKGTKGGELLLPEVDLAINVKNNVFMLMEGHRMIHGVAPIERTYEGAERYSVVYYSKKELFNCQVNLDEEIKKSNRKYTVNFVNKLENYDALKQFTDKMMGKLKERYAHVLDEDAFPAQEEPKQTSTIPVGPKPDAAATEAAISSLMAEFKQDAADESSDQDFEIPEN
mgnify:CR=1 FL=1